jgi:hypothetical protein
MPQTHYKPTGIEKGEYPKGMPRWLVGVMVLVGGFALFLAWGMFLGSTPDGKARRGEREAITECRRQVDDELQDLNTRRFVRDVCEKMEADYRLKWNRDP